MVREGGVCGDRPRDTAYEKKGLRRVVVDKEEEGFGEPEVVSIWWWSSINNC